MEFLSLSRRVSSSQNVPKWQLEILAKALPHVNDFLAYISLCQLTFPEPNLLLKFSVGNQKEYYQWRFTNQPSNLWSLSCGHDVLHVSYSSIVGATYEHLKICSNLVQDKSLVILFCLKKKKRNWRLSKATFKCIW